MSYKNTASLPPAFELKGLEPVAYGKPLGEFQPIHVEYYRQTTPPQQPPRDLAALGLTLEPFQYVEKETQALIGKVPAHGEDVARLSERQFHALYSAVGATSGWWPVEDKSFQASHLFNDTEMYMLKKEHMPIGFACIERGYEGNPAHTGIVYVGVIPSEQGKGYGKAFFQHMEAKAWQGDTKAVGLNTVPDFDRMTGTTHTVSRPASSLYEQEGFTLIKRELRNPADGHLNELNVPGFYTREAEIMEKRFPHVAPTHLSFQESRLAQLFGKMGKSITQAAEHTRF